MKRLNLSKVLARKYSIYLVTMMFMLVGCFMIFLQLIKFIGQKYTTGDVDRGNSIKYHGKFLVLEFENADQAIMILLIISVFIMIFIALWGILTYLYSGFTARTLNTSLSYLKMMIEKIRKEEYDFSEHQEKITEFAEIEEAFCTMAKKLNTEIENTRRSDEVRKRLMLDISHDLKNPLMGIDGYVELLQEMIKDEEQKKYLKIISENSKRANQHVMELFELAKLESAEYVIELKQIDLTEIIKKVLIERLDELECNGITSDFSIQDKEMLILGNEIQIRKALSNIIDNVMKYHKKNTILNVFCKKDDNKVKLIFSNTSALKLDNTELLIEPFFRLENSDKFNPQGTGIGLSIVRKIIEAHNGTINCYSDPENIFKISIELPSYS